MNFTIKHSELLRCFRAAASVVNTKISRDICRCVAIDLKAGACTGTDLERWIVAKSEDLRVGDGKVLLPADRGLRALEAIRSENVTLGVTDRAVTLSGPGVSIKLQAMNASEFPLCPPRQKALQRYEISVVTLLSGFGNTRFAADETSSRYALGGVALLAIDNRLTFCATDGRRMAFFATDMPSTQVQATIVPLATVAAVSRAFQSGGNVVAEIESSAIVFECGGITLRSAIVEGKYPRVADADVKASTLTGSVQCEAMLRAIDAATIVSARDKDGELLTGCDFSARPGSLVVQCQGAEIGEGEIETPAAIDHFKPVTIDVRLIRQWLQAIGKNQTVEVLFQEEGPSLFRCGPSRLIVMPMCKEV